MQLKDSALEARYLAAFHVYRNEQVAFILVKSPQVLDEQEQVFLSRQLRIVQGVMAETDFLQSRLVQTTQELRHFQEMSDAVATATAVPDPNLALSQLLRDCVDALSLKGAFFYHTDGKQFMLSITDEDVFESTGLSAARRSGVVQRELYRLCETSSAAFILEPYASKGASAARNRFDNLHTLVAPINDGQNQAVGVLVLARSHADTKFAKSDCRLAEMMAEKLQQVHQSRYDRTSGLLNRAAYEAVIRDALGQHATEKNESTFLVLRLDRLDEVYANGGTEAAVHVISQVSALLAKRVRSRDFAGRLSKDEFALLLQNCKTENAVIVADQVLEALSEYTFDWHGQALSIEGNIGIVTLSNTFVSPANLFRAARDAVDQAREAGKYASVVYDGASGKRSELSKIRWEHRIYKAVINKEFRLFCQPIEGTSGYHDGMHRYELFLRLTNDDGVLVAPYVFITTARKLGLMKYVDRWVVQQAFELIGAAHAQSEGLAPEYGFTVNLSAESLNMAFANYLIQLAERCGVVAESICFDITEAAATANLRETNKFIGLLKKRGFEFALDDFGTGIGAYSSLRNLAVDYVKLNGALVKNITHDPVSDAIVSSLAKVCRALGIKVIAESVESDSVKERLSGFGVDYVQGYQTGRPRPVEKEFSQFIAGNVEQLG